MSDDDNKNPQRPTHTLRILDTETQGRGTVGAAWVNPDGSIRIRLNPGVDLRYVDCLHCVITLFPARE